MENDMPCFISITQFGFEPISAGNISNPRADNVHLEICKPSVLVRVHENIQNPRRHQGVYVSHCIRKIILIQKKIKKNPHHLS